MRSVVLIGAPNDPDRIDGSAPNHRPGIGQFLGGHEVTTASDRQDPEQEDQARHDQENLGRADEVGDGADDDDRQKASNRNEHVEHPEDPTTDFLRKVLLELRLTRDCHDAVGNPGQERHHDDHRDEGRDCADVAYPGRHAGQHSTYRACHGQECQQGSERKQPTLDRSAPGHIAPVGVQEQDAHHDPGPERQDDEDQVLRSEPKRGLGELRSEHPDHADQ